MSEIELDILKLNPKLQKVFYEKPEFCCSITQCLFEDPVFVDGYNFERNAIQDWFKSGHKTNPQTNKDIPKDQRTNLRTNFDKKSSVIAYKEKIVKKCLKFYKEDYKDKSDELSVKICKKLLLRGEEVSNGENVEILSLLMKEFPKKRILYIKKIIKVHMKKKNYKMASELIMKEDKYKEDVALLTFLIQIKEEERKGVKKNEKVIKINNEIVVLQILLANVYMKKKQVNESIKILEGIDDDNHTIESLLLLFEINEKEKRENKVKHVILLIKYYKGENKCNEAMEVIKKMKNGKEKLKEMKEMKNYYKNKNEKKSASDLCYEISKSESELEDKITILDEGNKLNPTNYKLLQHLYETTRLYANGLLKKRIKELEKEVLELKNENKMLKKGNSSSNASVTIEPPTPKETPKETPKGDSLSTMTIHREHICDGCRSQPIIGARYSDEKEDFDLCEECYKEGKGGGRVFKVYYELGKPSFSTNDSMRDQLKQLREMGFYNEKMNRLLLKKYKGDLYKIVKELIKL